MAPSSAQPRVTAPAPRWLVALHAGIDAAREAVTRLFSPYAVALETRDDWTSSLTATHAGQLALGARHLGAAFTVEGPIRARLLFLAAPGDDERLTSALLRQPSTPERTLGPEERAAFSEMANIVASSFLNGLARDMKLRLLPSVPAVAENTLIEVRDALLSPYAWALAAHFTVALPSSSASGLFIAVPDLDTFGS